MRRYQEYKSRCALLLSSTSVPIMQVRRLLRNSEKRPSMSFAPSQRTERARTHSDPSGRFVARFDHHHSRCTSFKRTYYVFTFGSFPPMKLSLLNGAGAV